MFRDLTYDVWYGTSMSRLPTSAQSGQRLDYCFTCSNPRRPWRKSCVGKDAGSQERPWTCLCSLESLRDVKSGTKYVNMLHSQVSSAPKAVAVSRFFFFDCGSPQVILHFSLITAIWCSTSQLTFHCMENWWMPSVLFGECALFRHVFPTVWGVYHPVASQRNGRWSGIWGKSPHQGASFTWCLSVDRSGV